jgi:hypothetical protein
MFGADGAIVILTRFAAAILQIAVGRTAVALEEKTRIRSGVFVTRPNGV